MGGWDQTDPYGDYLECCGADSHSSGWGPVVGSSECGDEPLGFSSTGLVTTNLISTYFCAQITHSHITNTLNFPV